MYERGGRIKFLPRGASKYTPPPAQVKKNKFLGTEVPRNFSDPCSLDFANFLCLFSGRRSKSSQELCSWELFFLIFGGFSPCEPSGQGRPRKMFFLFSCAPGDGVKFLDRDIRQDIRPDVRGISRPKTLCSGFFSVPEAHKHSAHKRFLCHLGHRASRPGTRTKVFMLLGFRTQHINV